MRTIDGEDSKPAQAFLDGIALLNVIEELKHLYRKFPLESQVWARDGHRRSPYRALILFGLSPRTRDWLLVDICRRFFKEFPNLNSFLGPWPVSFQTVKGIVREGQLPFVQSVVDVLGANKGKIPQDPTHLMLIKGVGVKVAECIMAYGWGKEALPVDGNVCRVVSRISGLGHVNPRNQAPFFREQLKEVFNCYRERMAALGVAMIDIHELFRLHGQVVCTEAPQCSQCPLSDCALRQYSYQASPRPEVDVARWQEWRELLLNPTCGKMPAKINMSGE